jgi:hypothetical protein
VISSAKNGDDMRENIGNHPTIWVCFLVQWPRKNGHGSFSDELNSSLIGQKRVGTNSH